jgi:serine/threonine protein kinase/tetratricopeptide (TPR) repeat protein
MGKDTNCVFEFGPFRLDAVKNLLFRDGQPISLSPKVFETLLVLVQHSEQVVSKDELMKVLWPDSFVEEANLTQNISLLRKALGESPQDHRYIVTMPGRGYRFAEKVRVVPEEKPPATPTSQSTEVGPGSVVSHYRIREKIASGGMGVVYEAEDIRLGRRVALKFLMEKQAQDCKALERFTREARATSSLNHPNICTIYEIEEHAGGPIIVMELLHGQTLRDLMRKGRLEIGQVLDFGIQVTGALEAAHANGIIHRDMKPANIFVTNGGQAKILDFGLAKLTADYPGPAENLEDPLTEAGVGVGTTAYKSPEQARGDPLDPRSDLFSVGIVLYEMATRQRPFSGKNAVAVLDAILHSRPAPPLGLNPNLPPEMDAVLAKALEKDPARRYQGAGELRSDLQLLKKKLESGKVDGQGEARLLAGTASLTRSWFWSAVAGVIVLVGLGASGWLLYSRKAHRLTEKDTIVLADFSNSTGDPVFDGTLRQGMAVQLEQSPFLSLISDERIQQMLKLMAKPADARLTREIAREICERTASAAVLDGSIASLGSQYVLTLRAKGCRTGDVLDEEQVQAARKEDVLNALSQIASRFRTRVGESLSTVKSHDTPLAEATTPSLEALKAYSAGWQVSFSSGSAASVPFLQRAVEIDPNFASAYATLGRMYGDIGESALSAENTSRAYQLRDRASDQERFFISLTYDLQVTGNLEKAQQTCNLWVQAYPRAWLPHGLLSGGIYNTLGKYEKSVDEAKIAIGIDPDFSIGYSILAGSYLALGRTADAENTLQQAFERKLEIPDFYVQRFVMAFLRDDKTGMEREAAQSRDRPDVDDWMSNAEGFVSAYSGHLEDARKMSRRAADLARKADRRETEALYEADAAVREALLGNVSIARQRAVDALELSKGRDVVYVAGFALALAGDSSRSQALAEDLSRRLPEDTSVQFTYVPTLRALLALNHSQPSKAVELLQTAIPYEGGSPIEGGSEFLLGAGSLYPAYVRGLAYLAAHHGAEAAPEFQRILDHPGIVICDPIGALAHLQLGRAYAVSGDKTKAKSAYQDLLSLWKDADADIPIFKQAKAEYAKLQ